MSRSRLPRHPVLHPSAHPLAGSLRRPRARLGAMLLCATAMLAACDSAEERAEGHYQAGLERLAAGDVDRAMVEFRNVFQLDGMHRDARATYAGLLRERGQASQAFGQYLRLVEQYPDDLEGRRALAELALDSGDWEAVERHATAAAEIAPDDPSVRAVLASLAYRDATLAEDDEAREAAVADARALLETDPALTSARRVVLDDLLRARDWGAALAVIDAGLAVEPDAAALYRARLGLLRELGREDEIGPQLREMVERFPDDDATRQTLIQWLVSQGELDEAEAFLRGLIDPADPEPGARVTLVQFLSELRSPEAAREELDRIVGEQTSDPALFRSMRAALDFDAGRREEAIAEMEAILEETDPEDAPQGRLDAVRVALAKMLIADGNPVGARARVEEVLEDDPNQVEALKLIAGWLIEDDATGDAIASLRQALGQSPRDPEIMTLMARAHEREGNRELMAEMLSLAVEASSSAPEESLRYATYLAGEGQTRAAEDVLLDALRAAPQEVVLVEALGKLYVSTEDWARVEQAVDTLRRIGTAQADAAADGLVARQLAAQERGEELMTFLEGLSDEGQSRADVAIVRAQLSRGDAEAALAHAEAALEEAPDDPVLRFVRASVLAGMGRLDEAEAAYRALVEEQPDAERVWLALYRLALARGDAGGAAEVLEQAIAAVPESATLQWTRAGALEREGDVEGAIAIYDALYERDSDAPVIANNLASLLSTHRDDPESLQRAAVISRRLRGSDVPQFQDTYGWIAFRRGDVEEALANLEPAAAGLPDDPRVQHHYGLALAAAGRDEEALEVLTGVLDALGEARPDYRDAVETEVARLRGEGGAEDGEAGAEATRPEGAVSD